jgi:head-tail adaptor
MSYGKMKQIAQIVLPGGAIDSEGFRTTQDTVVANIRAYREGRHGSEKWANRALFSEATDLFRFRHIPGVTISTKMVIVCGEERFNITSVEDIRGRNMYIDCLAKKVVSSGGAV